MLNATCDISRLICHMLFFIFFFFYKGVKPVNGWSVIKGATPSFLIILLFSKEPEILALCEISNLLCYHAIAKVQQAVSCCKTKTSGQAVTEA